MRERDPLATIDFRGACRGATAGVWGFGVEDAAASWKYAAGRPWSASVESGMRASSCQRHVPTRLMSRSAASVALLRRSSRVCFRRFEVG